MKQIRGIQLWKFLRGVSLTLDLNGHTLSTASGWYGNQLLSVKGELILQDSGKEPEKITQYNRNSVGVAVESTGVFNMKAGMITNCMSGVRLAGGKASFTGGTISGNEYGVMYNSLSDDTSYLKISGDMKICDNMERYQRWGTNLVLYDDSYITVDGILEEGSRIGVSKNCNMKITDGMAINGYSAYNSAAPDTFFFSDIKEFDLGLTAAGEIELISKNPAWENLGEQMKQGGSVVLTEDITLNSFSNTIEVPENTQFTLDLNGHTIDFSNSTEINAIYSSIMVMPAIAVYGDFTLKDSGKGTGRIITKKDTYAGSCIAVYKSGNFVMEGGTIGEGCFKYCLSVSDGKFTMLGGTISNAGYGVLIYGGDISIRGGSIKDNSTGIACMGYSDICMKMSGSPVIKDNKSTSYSGEVTIGDVTVPSENAIIIDGRLEKGACIGVTSGNELPVVIAKDYAKYNDEDPNEFFFSDTEGLGMALDENGDVILKAMITPEITDLTVSDLTYGQSLSDCTVTGTAKAEGKEISGEFVFTDTEVIPAVSDSGKTKYPVRFVPDDKENYISVRTAVTLNIKPADISGAVITLGDALTENGSTQTQTIRNVILDGREVTYAVKNDSDKVQKAGTYTLEIEGTGNYTGTLKVSYQVAAKVENPFADVPAGQYYTSPVLWAVENNITAGVGAGQFAPDDSCTRAQVVTFLWRAKGKPTAKNSKNPFVDVNKDTYYYDAVLWAYENGVVSGIDATHFGSDATVTRAQFVTFLYRAENKPSYSVKNPFKDVSAGQYFTDPILWAYEKGVTAGVDSTHFGTDNPCTRGQVVTFLYRELNK